MRPRVICLSKNEQGAYRNSDTNNIQNYSVNFMVLKQLLNIMGNFDSIQEIMEYYDKKAI